MPNPFVVLLQAIKAVPAVKYALGVAGLVAVVAIVRLFGVNPLNAVFGCVIVLFLMTALVIFAKLTTLRTGPFRLPAMILMWAALALLVACAVFLFTSTFFDWPLEMKPTTRAAIVRKENRLVKIVKLGVEEMLIKSKLGEPLRRDNVNGFRHFHYAFTHYDVNMIFDHKRKVMQYDVLIKSPELQLEFDEPEPATGHSLKLGADSFSTYPIGVFRPVYMDAIASDAEPFYYFELLDGEPGTDVSVRLEFVASRIRFPDTGADREALDSLSQKISEVGCTYQIASEGPSPFNRVETVALMTWRAEVLPNSITIQRRLSEAEQTQLGEKPGESLCPLGASEEAETQ